SYEQDNDASDGAEPIEWIVLEYDAASGQALLLSKYALEAKAFHDGEAYPTWEKSDIRAWLNGEFLNAAFTAEEQSAIAETALTTSENALWTGISAAEGGEPAAVGGGADTNDKVFLLSTEDVLGMLGFASAEEALSAITADAEAGAFAKSEELLKAETLKAVPTAYAVANGAWQDDREGDAGKLDGEGCCWWWLRSPGYDGTEASCVSSSGALGYDSVSDTLLGCVRPALCLQMKTA
ncbi:MAG: hypothetical protein HUJ65_03970, partial [Oscillospiraceae bacterium]|nr:hypothetical protein [Oscillospiraceae bacterium]